eukprot:9477203-Pyramimonas_sp.AAC.1
MATTTTWFKVVEAATTTTTATATRFIAPPFGVRTRSATRAGFGINFYGGDDEFLDVTRAADELQSCMAQHPEGNHQKRPNSMSHRDVWQSNRKTIIICPPDCPCPSSTSAATDGPVSGLAPRLLFPP